MKSIITIGGGTGQFTLLSGLKKYPVELTAIVTMADDGGSTGMLRDELGVLPPGDIRQCLVALSEAETIVRELFNYRFDTGSLKGHNFGNIFLSALEKVAGNFEEAVRVSGMVLATRGKVVPVTTQSARLVCRAGELVIHGEHNITPATIPAGAVFSLEPEVYANPKAVEAIERADLVVIGPGDLYSSIMPNLLVKGIPEAIMRSGAKVIYNCNLMNKTGHTDDFGVRDYVASIEQYIGTGRIDAVIYNSRMPERELLERYAMEGEYPVEAECGDLACDLLPADLISRKMPVQKAGDPLKRTLIRHDSDLLASLIVTNCLGGV
jgi:uncharacterized cofD-like protein